MAMTLSENVLAFWSEVMADEDAAETEAAAQAAATVDMEEESEVPFHGYTREVEEDDGEDVYNKSGRVFQSKLGSNLGKYEQKERAKVWAESALNIKTTKRGAYSASKAAKTPALPAKSAEQQRADAAAYASKTFGESVLSNRSPVKSAEKAATRRSVGNNSKGSSDENSTRNNTSSSSSTATDTTPKKEQPAVKKEASPVPSGGANSKPLTALQIAKAEMKRAEAERIANLVASKKSKK